MPHFSFEYSPVNCNIGWTPKARTWRTKIGAKKAAEKWECDMQAEGCEVATRIVEIINNRPVVVEGVPHAITAR